MTETTLAPTADDGQLARRGTWRFPGGREVQLGNRAARVVARLVDVGLVSLAAPMFVGMMLVQSWPLAVLGALGLATIFAAFTALLARQGRTPGKLLFGLKIVRTDGSNPGFWRAVVVREGLRVLFVLGFNIGTFIDAATLLRNDWRTLHDRAAGTIVIYAPWRR